MTLSFSLFSKHSTKGKSTSGTSTNSLKSTFNDIEQLNAFIDRQMQKSQLNWWKTNVTQIQIVEKQIKIKFYFYVINKYHKS